MEKKFALATADKSGGGFMAAEKQAGRDRRKRANLNFHMFALGLSLALFVFLAMVGRATLVVGRYRSSVLRAWLLAPAVGLAVLVLALMVLNQAGWPIRSFAGWLTAGLGLASVAVLARTRPPFPRRALAIFAGAVVGMLLWTGWPALEFGFNWVSYANDDMANYCLGAERFVDCGFWDLPAFADFAGRDYTRYYWYPHVADMMRFGSEHVLAWAVGITGLKATQVFMPTIMMLAGLQLCATGALVLHRGRHRRWAAATAWLLALSPMFMLGTLYQMIAQVGGLALLSATLALLTERIRGHTNWAHARAAVLPALTSATLCIYYPEVTPFVVLAFGGFVVLEGVRWRALPVGHLSLAIFTLAGVTVLLRYNLIAYVYTFMHQFASAVREADLSISLFPYFMLPTGFSNLFGWMPVAYDFPEPVVTLSIVAGMALTAAALWCAARESARATPVAVLFLVQFALALRLFTGGNDFGLYKMAMFMQPALMAGVAWWLLRLPRSAVTLPLAVALLGLTFAPTALYYTQTSRGLRSGGITEVRYASKLGLALTVLPAPGTRLFGALDNVVAAKFAASELRGRMLSLVSRDYFETRVQVDYRHPILAVRLHPHYAEMAQAPFFLHQRETEIVGHTMLWQTEFVVPRAIQQADAYVSLAPQLSLFNKFGLDPAEPIKSLFIVAPAAAVQNLLLFVHSNRGNHYYLGDRRRISLFQQEPDLFAPGHDFAGLGRFLLLRVERPTEEIYLRVAATRTQLLGRTGWSSRALLHAATDQPLDLLGHGAFNRIVGPLKPLWHEGAAYVAIDFMETPESIPDFRHGLKALYHADVPLDSRRLVGWGRDISVLSPAQYAALARPRRLARFPQDLLSNDALEFSGIYEDGWLSPDSEFVLAGAQAGGCVRLRGSIPALAGMPLGTGELLVSINGAPTIPLPAKSGRFDWQIPITSGASQTRVRLHFTASAPLPGNDTRPVGGALDLLEISPTTAQAWDFTQSETPRLVTTGIDQDGWTARTATLLLPARPQPVELVARFEYPGWGGNGQLLRVRLDGKVIAAQNLTPGITEVSFALAASAAPQTIEWLSEGDFPLPSPDGRRRACRLLSVELRPAAADLRIAPAQPASQGIDADGWVAPNARLIIPAHDRAGEIVLRLEYPGWAGRPGAELRLALEGQGEFRRTLVPGENVIRVPLPASGEIRMLHLNGDEPFELPAPDGRRRTCRLIGSELRLAPDA